MRLILDTEAIRDQLLNILLAARDTVSSLSNLTRYKFQRVHSVRGFQTTALLSHTVYFFAMHPDVLKKAREEILDVFGPGGSPTAENMRGLKYRKSYQHHNPKSTQKSSLSNPTIL